MRSGEHEVARAYVLYREERRHERDLEGVKRPDAQIHVVHANGERKELNIKHVYAVIQAACEGLLEVNPKLILDEALKNLYDGVSEEEVFKSVILAARQLIESEPAYNSVTARLLMHTIRKEVIGREVSQNEVNDLYKTYFAEYIQKVSKLNY